VNPRYTAVARRADHRCEYCRAPERLFNTKFDVEHVTPVSRGGADDPENLALACRICNQKKGDATTGPDPAGAAQVYLFDPRRDRWIEHFAIDPDDLSVLGLTPAGRATVERLDMNNADQLAARAIWAELGLFP
jgi:hypothetical protein